MMPARPSGFASSRDQQEVRRRGRSTWPFSSVSVSPSRAKRTTMAPSSSAVVVGVQRLPQFEHHVVGDVDDGGNRANAAALEPLLHPRRRRRRGVDAVDQPRDEARTRGGVLDAHLRASRRSRPVSPRACGSATARRCAAATSRAMPASDRQSARFGVSLSVSSASSSASASRKIGAGRECIVERQQAAGVVGQPELLRGAEHAVRLDAAHRRALDRESAGQHRAFERARREHARGGVRRAADDRSCRAADVDHADATADRRSGAAPPLRFWRRPRAENGGRGAATSSTSRPAIVSASHSAPCEIGGSHSVRSQRSENFMRPCRQANCRRKRRSFS